MRHVEPCIRLHLIGKTHHDFHRHPVARITEIAGLGSIRPFRLGGIVGFHPIHEPQRAKIRDVADPVGIKQLACIQAFRLVQLDKSDVANIVAGPVPVGLVDGYGNRARPRFKVKKHFALAIANIRGPPADFDNSIAPILQPIAPGERARQNGHVGQNHRSDPSEILGNPNRPAMFIKDARRVEVSIFGATPLPRTMTDPGARGLHDVQKRLLDRPVNDPRKPDGHVSGRRGNAICKCQTKQQYRQPDHAGQSCGATPVFA